MNRYFLKDVIPSNVKEDRFRKQGIMSRKKSLRKIRLVKPLEWAGH